MEIQEIKDDCKVAIKNLLEDVRKTTISKQVIYLSLENINLKSISKASLNLKLEELIPVFDLPIIYNISNLNFEASIEIYDSFAKAKTEKLLGRSY